MIPLRDALDRALKSVRLQNVSTLATISAHWPAIVGGHLAGVCDPAYIAKNTLVIHVHDRAFLEPLNYARLQVLEKTRNVIGVNNNVQNVTVSFAERPELPFPAAVERRASTPLAAGDEQKIDAAAAHAADADLKGSLERLFRAGASRGRKCAAIIAIACLMPMLAACATGGKSPKPPAPVPTPAAAGGKPAASPADAAEKAERERKAYTHYLTAQMLINDNKLPEALEELRKAVKADPSAISIYLDISRTALAVGKYREAIDAAQEGLIIQPDFAPLNALLGGIYYSSKNYTQAEKYYRKTLELDPTRTEIRLALGVNYMEMKRYDDAERELRRALKDDPQSQATMLYLARVYVEMKQYFKAEEFLTATIQEHPTFTKAYETLGWVYLAQEKYDLAIDTYNKYLEGDPGNEMLRQRLANAFLMKKDYNKALDVYKEIEKLEPGTSDLALKMGLLYFQRGEWKEALEKFQLVRLKDPANETAPYYIARIYEEMGMHKESLEVWGTLVEGIGNNDAAEIYVHMGSIYEKIGQLDNTRAMLEKALAKNKDNPDINYLMGVILVKMERYPAALKSIGRAIELAPNRSEFIFYLGATYEKTKEYDKCETAMRKVLEINPSHGDAMNYIAYLYAVQNRKLDEALQLIHRALEIEPDNGYYLDTLSWIYHQQGKNDMALTAIEKAIAQTKEKDATVYEHLGDIHYALGHFADAAGAFAVSLEVKNNPDVKMKLDDAKTKAKGTK